MCEVLDRIENRGISIGKAEGKAEGRAEQARETARNLYSMGLSVESIAKAVGYATETVKSWLNVQPA